MFLEIFAALAAFFLGLPLLLGAVLFVGMCVIGIPLCLLVLLIGPKD